jgi:EthD domain
MPDMYKSIGLFKRKKGLSHEEFKEYYEGHHVPFKLRVMKIEGVVRYVRRYLTPLSDPASDAFRHSGFDVITEVWFKDKASFDAYRSFSLDPEYRKMNDEDEEKFLDRENMYFHTVDEQETRFS